MEDHQIIKKGPFRGGAGGGGNFGGEGGAGGGEFGGRGRPGQKYEEEKVSDQQRLELTQASNNFASDLHHSTSLEIASHILLAL